MEKLIQFIHSLTLVDIYEITMTFAVFKLAFYFGKKTYQKWMK